MLSVDADTVLFAASGSEIGQIALWAYGPEPAGRGGAAARSGAAAPTRVLRPVQPGDQPPGVRTGVRGGGLTVVACRSLAGDELTVLVLRGAEKIGRIASLAERPLLPQPRPELFAAGQRQVAAALLLPSWHEPGSALLPVLVDSYGGPHGQRVLASQAAFLASQWFAEQGFAVLVADGRGMAGRGPEWERAIAGDLAGPVLDDQVEALRAAADRCPDLDLERVAIRGWSFGGYLAALAVLRRPDVFHAAVAGAPVTDWRLYDTHYTERYLGLPEQNPAAYASSSLIADAPRLTRPLMLIHGLADDNVVAAHTLRLSAALLAAGRPHAVLPLPGITHLASRSDVAENLLLLQADFLRRALRETTALG